ncbi:hypothetical protein [Neolewinella antarctica]|uniref:Uncharacterized protein n=1 Tax=Neolewinella antarctica TaxID=442734 RepID=A0ABX0XEP8_9BACT|nr:hypothetical protein [Neolewinella antarctica]NJC27358.1 hypothetical protein [Neolewinella antarctica]
MRQSPYLLALLCLLCTGVRAQVLTVSDELTMRNDTEYSLLGKLGGQTLLFQDRDTKHFLTAFDRTMGESWEKELELRGRNVRLIDAVAKQDGSGFNLVYFYRDGGKNHLQIDLYNPAGNLRDSVTVIDFSLFVASPDDEVYLSEDESKLVMMITDQSTKPRIIGVDLAELSLLYDRVIEPDKFYFGEDFLQAEVSNAGELFFIIERDNFKSKRKKHRFEVHTVSPTKDNKSFDVTMGDSLTYDMYFRYDNRNERLVGGGLYTTRDFTKAEGYFWVAVDPAASGPLLPKFTPFPLPLIKNIQGKKYSKKHPGIDELSVRDLVLRHDGGALLITERNRQLERRSAASRTQMIADYGTRPLVDYHYDEMIVFSVHPDGKPHWSNILHKKQYSQDDGGVYSGYFMMENPRSLRFLFNDEIRFENTVSEYVVNGRGEFDRNSLFNTRDLNLRLRFRDGVQVAGNEVIMPSEHRNKLRLVKMTYAGK